MQIHKKKVVSKGWTDANLQGCAANQNGRCMNEFKLEKQLMYAGYAEQINKAQTRRRTLNLTNSLHST